jgi:hypothetical protein
MNRSLLAHAFLLLLPALAGTPLAAQDAGNAPPATATVVSRSAGLRSDDDGTGLLGGAADYRVRFTPAGMRFEPALGSAARTTQHLALRPLWLARGANVLAEFGSPTVPVADGLVARYARGGGATERYELRADAVELTWHFAEPLPGDGDVVVRYAVDTSLPARRPHGDGLVFELSQLGGARIGGVHGIDAAGRRADGTLRLVPGGVELVLPAAFVATARYPLVLDPTIGAIVPVESNLANDADPDVAYDATTDRWLVVWQRTFASADRDIRGQRLSSTGALVGGTILFNSAGIASRPQLANLRTRARFGVVWSQNTFLATTIEFAAVDAASGAITHSTYISSPNGLQVHLADIGAESDAPAGAGRDFVIVFANQLNGPGTFLLAKRLWFTAADMLQAAPTYQVDMVGFSLHEHVNISRAAGSDRRLLVTATNQWGVRVAVVRTDSSQVEAFTTISEAGFTHVASDVDGRAGRWVLCRERRPTAGGNSSIVTAPVTFANGTLTIGAAVVSDGGTYSDASSPSLGYAPGKTWLGYRRRMVLSTQAALRVSGIDATTCVSCNDVFSDTVTGPENRIVVGTMASGGATTGDNALAVWARAGDVHAQRLVNHGNGGTVTMLGGACGSGGTQSFAHNPAIGSSGLACSVSGLPPSTAMSVFNLSPVMSLTSCGPCQWLPFAEIQMVNVLAGTASIELPIPCQQTLIGTQFETQWTTVDASQTNCSVLPGYMMTNRALLTIGQ